MEISNRFKKKKLSISAPVIFQVKFKRNKTLAVTLRSIEDGAGPNIAYPCPGRIIYP